LASLMPALKYSETNISLQEANRTLREIAIITRT
jgi:hypothetical protein